MLSSGDQEKACGMIDKVRERHAVRPVVLVRQDQYGTVTLTPVDHGDNDTDLSGLQATLDDVEVTPDYSLEYLIEELVVLACWPEDVLAKVD